MNNIKQNENTQSLADVLLTNTPSEAAVKLALDTHFDTHIQPELKQRVTAALAAQPTPLPAEAPIDVRHNEVFDFHTING